ncbi:MAG: hypothetical protein ACRCYJ_16415, partial [Plesiomonas shigelloides]
NASGANNAGANGVGCEEVVISGSPESAEAASSRPTFGKAHEKTAIAQAKAAIPKLPSNAMLTIPSHNNTIVD